MVVLAASVCTKQGTAVISRQFVEMSRSRIEGLLVAFPKLITANTQHTYCENDNVRFIYQAFGEMYLVLITNKKSNIWQDIETLNLFQRTVTDCCRSMKQADIVSNGFEILSAFDEIISLGYREDVTVAQIRTNLQMESHEEKLQEMLQKSKEREAIESAKLKAKQLEMQKREMMKKGNSSMNSSSSGYTSPPKSAYQSEPQAQKPPSFVTPQTSTSSVTSSSAAPPKKGMQLGKPKNNNFLQAIVLDEGLNVSEQGDEESNKNKDSNERFGKE